MAIGYELIGFLLFLKIIIIISLLSKIFNRLEIVEKRIETLEKSTIYPSAPPNYSYVSQV